ncbi:MAG: 5'-nucleotidase C-terminal domain-containing protein, partial [Pikeienuella sp.]
MNDFENNFALQLFHFSDQEANTTSTELAPNLSAVLNALRAQDIDGDGTDGYVHTLTLSSGDAWIPGLFYSASETIYGAPGAADILIQNELGVQAISFGNHEFDQGTGIIAELISGDIDFGDDDPADFQPFEGANFPYLAGNLDYSQDANLAPLATADGQNVADIAGQVSGTALVTTDGGETIGLVSAVVPTIDDGLTSPGPDLIVLPESNDLTDLAAVIQEDVDALLAANPDLDKIILLSHQQLLSREVELAGLLEGVDIIMAGGSNSVLLDENDAGFDGEAADEVYPIFVDGADSNPVAVVNTDAAYNYVGRLVIDFDENGVIIPESYDAEISGAYETSDAGVARVGAEGLADPEIVEIAQLVEDTIVEGESTFFAVTTEFLNAERAGGGTDGVRTQETNLGNLTADANLSYVQQFDDEVVFSFKNGGGIRANIGQIVQPAGDGDPQRLPPEGVPGAKPEGGISQNDINDTLAFNNGLTLLSLTTQQIVDTVEATLENYTSLEQSAGGWGQFAGLRFSFSPDLPAGDRIVDAALVDEETGEIIAELVRNGEVVDNGDTTFRTVTLNFLANGGADGLPVTNPDEDGFDADIAAATNRVDLVNDENPVFDGGATFAATGSEQDALAEYLLAEFGNEEGDPTVDLVDTTPRLDARIQNLDFRAGDVFDDREIAETATAVIGEDAVVSASDVTITGSAADVAVSGLGGGVSLLGDAGATLVFGAESLTFDDAVWRADDSVSALTVGQMYYTAFGRLADVGGATFWANLLDTSIITASDLADVLVGSSEFSDKNGEDLSDEAFVDALVANANATDLFEEAELDAFVAALADGSASRSDVFLEIATSDAVGEATEAVLGGGVIVNADDRIALPLDEFRVLPYLQQPTEDGMLVTWFTENEAPGELVVSGGGLAEPLVFTSTPEYQSLLEYREPALEDAIENDYPILANTNYKHSVMLTGLEAGTTYDYSVTQNEAEFSAQLTTSPGDDWQQIRFVALADSETEPRGATQIRDWTPGVQAEDSLGRPDNLPTDSSGRDLYLLNQTDGYAQNVRIIDERNPDLVVMPGDLIQGGGYQFAWDEFFRHNAGEFDDLLTETPLLPALGNWENFSAINGGYGISEDFNSVAFGRSKYKTYFDMPSNGTDSHQDNYYRLDYGPITFITLDSSNGEPDVAGDERGDRNAPNSDTNTNIDAAEYRANNDNEFTDGTDLSDFNEGSIQAAWLEEQLADARANGQIVFVQYHHASYTSGTHGIPNSGLDGIDGG